LPADLLPGAHACGVGVDLAEGVFGGGGRCFAEVGAEVVFVDVAGGGGRELLDSLGFRRVTTVEPNRCGYARFVEYLQGLGLRSVERTAKSVTYFILPDHVLSAVDFDGVDWLTVSYRENFARILFVQPLAGMEIVSYAGLGPRAEKHMAADHRAVKRRLDLMDIEVSHLDPIVVQRELPLGRVQVKRTIVIIMEHASPPFLPVQILCLPPDPRSILIQRRADERLGSHIPHIHLYGPVKFDFLC